LSYDCLNIYEILGNVLDGTSLGNY
jgi:hypothetical protein